MTFAELGNRIKMVFDVKAFEVIPNLTLLLQEAENEFIRRTLCLQKQIDIKIEASTVAEFDGTETNVSFVKGSGNTKDTITDSDDGFVADNFAAGQELVVYGSTNNDGTYLIDSVAVGTITLNSIGVLTSEAGIADMTMIAGQIPYKIALPSDFILINRVEFRSVPLLPTHQQEGFPYAKTNNDIFTGTPRNYWIDAENIILIPKPTTEGMLKLWYNYYITSNATTSPTIPTIEHIKLINHVLGILYDMNEQPKIADRYYVRFERDCNKTAKKYKLQRFKQVRISDVNSYHFYTNDIDQRRVPIVTG